MRKKNTNYYGDNSQKTRVIFMQNRKMHNEISKNIDYFTKI